MRIPTSVIYCLQSRSHIELGIINHAISVESFVK